MMLATADESIRRVRSLCGSLECILTCPSSLRIQLGHVLQGEDVTSEDSQGCVASFCAWPASFKCELVLQDAGSR